jgi:hypothetical protein
MRACLLTGLLPFTAAVILPTIKHTITEVSTVSASPTDDEQLPAPSVEVPESHSTSTTTLMLTVHPSTLKPAVPTKSQVPDPKGEHNITDSRKAHDNFQLKMMYLDDIDDPSVPAFNENNNTMTLAENLDTHKDVWIPTYGKTGTHGVNETNAIFKLRHSELETDSKRSEVHDTLYWRLVQGTTVRDRGVYFPMLTTNSHKDHILGQNVVGDDGWALIRKPSTNFYQLANSKIAGDFAICTVPSIKLWVDPHADLDAQEGVKAEIDSGATLVYGDRATLEALPSKLKGQVKGCTPVALRVRIRWVSVLNLSVTDIASQAFWIDGPKKNH